MSDDAPRLYLATPAQCYPCPDDWNAVAGLAILVVSGHLGTKVLLESALAPEIDLAPFFALMRDENVVKVFHSGRQDVEILWILDRCIPTPCFDTQIAAMVAGYGEVNLGDSEVLGMFLSILACAYAAIKAPKES